MGGARDINEERSGVHDASDEHRQPTSQGDLASYLIRSRVEENKGEGNQ